MSAEGWTLANVITVVAALSTCLGAALSAPAVGEDEDAGRPPAVALSRWARPYGPRTARSRKIFKKSCGTAMSKSAGATAEGIVTVAHVVR